MRVVQMNPYSTVSPSPFKPTEPVVREEHITPSVNRLDFKNFKTDDWILLAIIAVLILEGSEDYILLCALGYLFVMGLV